MTLSILIVNYNTQQLLEQCLRSVRNNINIENEVIVVDNASAKFNQSALKKIIPKITIIESSENLGFGKANNLAAKQATGEYLWLLNSDCEVPADHNISGLLEFLDINTEYAAALPKLTDASGKVQSSQIAYLPSIWRMVLEKPIKSLIAKKPSRKKYFGWVNADWLATRQRNVQRATAAALVIRRAVFKDVGGFRPDYFLYYEDDDLCAKLGANRQKIAWIPNAHIIHKEGQSLTDITKKKEIAYQSQDIYFKIWKGPISRWLLTRMRSLYRQAK